MPEELKKEQEQPATDNEEQVINDAKIFAIVAYIGILCLLPLLLKKDNKFALHHGKQGLVIFIAEVICGMLGVIPILGWLMAPVLFIILAFYSLIGIIQAASGKYWKAPIVADLAEKINL
ncbi:MAG: DUF4870 domain-containing protein [Candidatus Omnitrophica bacterium]|nr:DUF4870 domain-containing protein [Candidatus Omnitrophota bacterium]